MRNFLSRIFRRQSPKSTIGNPATAYIDGTLYFLHNGYVVKFGKNDQRHEVCEITDTAPNGVSIAQVWLALKTLEGEFHFSAAPDFPQTSMN